MTDAPAMKASPARPRWMERWGIPALDQPGAVVFMLALLIQSVGNGLFVSFVLIYFHNVAGLKLSDVGLAITIASAVGLVANPLAGQIVDRAGAKNMVSASLVVQ